MEYILFHYDRVHPVIVKSRIITIFYINCSTCSAIAIKKAIDFISIKY